MTDYVQPVLGMLCIGAIKFLDLTDPDTIFFARCAYACGSILVLTTLAVLYMRINQNPDTQQLVLTQGDLNPPPPMAKFIGVPTDPDSNKPTTITVQEYDLVKLQTIAKSAITTMCITTALHVWKGFMPPLVFQSVTQQLASTRTRTHTTSSPIPRLR